jgi:glutamate dehydrogenase
MYAFSAAKFTFYFSHRESDEFIQLSKFLKNDSQNLSRLSSINKKLKKDSITELRIEDCIFDNIDLVKEIFVDFAQICMNEKKPAINLDLIKKINGKLSDEIDKLILTSFVTFNASILKTNFYKYEKSSIAFRLDPNFLKPMVPSIYPDLPFAVFLVISSDFIGFHVRFSDIARGGIRIIKSNNKHQYQLNLESLFNENYGLANTQQRKNKDIPEGGSKGTILLFPDKQHTVDTSFHKYIDSLLDLLLIEKDVTDHYQTPEILFCGPDENTAHLMDWGALHAKKRGASFWKAFTTGKSTSIGGIPHDVYGMTTNSVHQYALGIYNKLGLQEKDILKCQTGGPDGDLGGNEILMSDDKTIAIVDGSGVLYDPVGINKPELLRLIKQPTLKEKTISNFDITKLSKDGFRVSVDDSNITLPNGETYENGYVLRNNFHLNPLFKGDIFIPCGGRPESININNVKHMFDEQGKLKFKYIVEGANLFISQEARIFLENKGVVLFKDASANKGGVTSSSNEVLAALSMNNEEFEKNMQIKDGVVPEFYKIYVQYVIEKITSNASKEFECLWREHQKTGKNVSLLSDEVSYKINSLNDSITASSLWENKEFVTKVMNEALPPPLIKLLGLEKIMERVPENYLRAIFGAHLACNYIYSYGLLATEFEFYEFMNKYSK